VSALHLLDSFRQLSLASLPRETRTLTSRARECSLESTWDRFRQCVECVAQVPVGSTVMNENLVCSVSLEKEVGREAVACFQEPKRPEGTSHSQVSGDIALDSLPARVIETASGLEGIATFVRSWVLIARAVREKHHERTLRCLHVGFDHEHEVEHLKFAAILIDPWSAEFV